MINTCITVLTYKDVILMIEIGFYFLGVLVTLMGIKFFYGLDIRKQEDFWGSSPLPFFSTLLWFIAVPIWILSLASGIPSLKEIQDKMAKDRQFKKDLVELCNQPPHDMLDDYFRGKE